MTREIQRIIRAGIALQVAALEWEESDINDTESIRGIETALKELQRLVKSLAKEVRAG